MLPTAELWASRYRPVGDLKDITWPPEAWITTDWSCARHRPAIEKVASTFSHLKKSGSSFPDLRWLSEL